MPDSARLLSSAYSFYNCCSCLQLICRSSWCRDCSQISNASLSGCICICRIYCRYWIVSSGSSQGTCLSACCHRNSKPELLLRCHTVSRQLCAQPDCRTSTFALLPHQSMQCNATTQHGYCRTCIYLWPMTSPCHVLYSLSHALPQLSGQKQLLTRYSHVRCKPFSGEDADNPRLC